MSDSPTPAGSFDASALLVVLLALKHGDFSMRLPVDWTGLAGKIADTLNDVITLNERLTHELERVSHVVGKEGKIDQRLVLGDVGGSWAMKVTAVNTLIDDLTRPTSEMARVIGAVAKGDLSQTMALEVDDRPLEGQFLRTARVVNTMVDQLGSFASEVTRVAREVGTEGKLGGQAQVKGVAGTWKDLTDNVNLMAGSLTGQVRNIAEVTTAIANGDLSKKITVDVKGEILELKNTVNTMVDQLKSFASEVTRVSREVGAEGKLGAQADVKGVAGVWKDVTDNVNFMAGSLTGQVRNIAEVTTAVATGDLSRKITADAKGEILELKNTINTMVDQLNSFASEVTRVAREVGTEGMLGVQAEVPGVAGTWKDLTDNVNSMAANLTGQVRNIAEVSTAIATGDLSKKISADAKGEILELKNTINTMVDQLNSFASEVTRVAREVGAEGKLGGQAQVKGGAGIWKDLTDNVNFMAGSLTDQVRNIAEVTTAVANGDLSKKITVDVRGEILELKNTVNTMVDQLNSFASEVTRVAREVGTDGKLGGQAEVKGVAGTWKDLTDNVNSMASNLTGQVRNIAEVTTAVATGDLSKKITADARGEILELKDTINTMVDQLGSFASEVTRVAREVGTDGKLGGQAEVKGVAGTWKDLTDNVNLMASNLTGQVRNIAEVTTAVATGDLSKKIAADARGEILELKDTINTMVDQLNAFASEVTRVAREVGTDGKLGGQAEVKGVAGVWKDLTDNVNYMAGNLTTQVRNIADVTTAVATGDLSRKISADAKGEILELKNTINTMVDQLGSFASEVTRVAREVGTDGKLGGQAVVKDVAGVWKDLTDNVNSMANNLTVQVRNIAEVTTAVANGDLSRKISADAKGEILELKDTINTMVDQLNSFASEVTRVAREVGAEGKLGGQAQVKGVAGTWKDLTDNVNFMAGSLTGQVRNIAEVTTAVANGDLSRKISADAKGEILELKNTVNTMVDQLNSFASEVTRVAREVGTDGKLGAQAEVKGGAGVWKDLTDNVNLMASNLTGQVRNIAYVTTAVANGDLTRKITADAKGEILELKDTINIMVDQLSSFASEVTRVAREVGTDGKLGGQAYVLGVAGTWKDLTDNVNLMASNLTGQVRNIAYVTTAVANGDLSRKSTADAKGEILELKNTVNTMVDQLGSFASEVTRVAREVGTEGKLGGQAQVKGVSGTWKDLTDSVNFMASNLTGQVRGIAKVVTGVANGDLKQKLTVEAKGEIAALADTINGMIDTLATFADQVTSVAREVGVEGKLGGQASVPGAVGTWKDLTDNVNQLAANLSTQVRTIAEVATAVTKGDLTRSIRVEARGEVAVLKDNINEMIRNLRDTTQRNQEQDWLKSNLATFTRRLQGQKDLLTVSKMILSELAPLVSGQHGAFFLIDSSRDEPYLMLRASYGYRERKGLSNQFKLAEGLVGQCALEKERILITDVPSDYIQINSGLGMAPPLNIVVLPVLFEGQIKAVIELASFQRFSTTHVAFLDQLTESIGIVLNTIESNMRTEDLLKQSQSLAGELQSQQEELRKTNEELEEKARLLARQNAEVERKNIEVEQSRVALEEKADQLSITSKYKSEFLSTMSHELRTPLNSMLLLSRQLADNSRGNLTVKQVSSAQMIQEAGSDLLTLINDILDLSKIESGTVALDIEAITFVELRNHLEGMFRSIAENAKLGFRIELDSRLPQAITTDVQRLLQILKNLLSNAFKFTHVGEVRLRIVPAQEGWLRDQPKMDRDQSLIAFAVQDTGIGIAPEKHKVIFEAFQQADGTTSRKYGGTGLGLSISRELARLLRGEIRLESVVDQGSTFTLYLPQSLGSPQRSAMDGGDRKAQGRNSSDRSDSYLRSTSASAHADIQRVAQEIAARDLVDDRGVIRLGDQVLLIVEDDVRFANILMDLAHEYNWKVVFTPHGAETIMLVHRFPIAAVILDIILPDTTGWVVLDQLKHDPATRHLPIHIISVIDESQRGLAHGASSYLTKPVDIGALRGIFAKASQDHHAAIKHVLVIEDDPAQATRIAEHIGSDAVVVTVQESGQAILGTLEAEVYDCLILNFDLPNHIGIQILETIMRHFGTRSIPIIIHTMQELDDTQRTQLQSLAAEMIIKDIHWLERLLDATVCVLYGVEKGGTQPAAEGRRDSGLAGKKMLIVDDDVRNIYALTSILEEQDITVLFAENGQTGLDILQATPDIDLVVMDVMMPVMDGYETMRAIRKIIRFRNLPIIALTAHAMKGDRERCIEAGASDYVAKPVTADQILALCHTLLA